MAVAMLSGRKRAVRVRVRAVMRVCDPCHSADVQGASRIKHKSLGDSGGWKLSVAQHCDVGHGYALLCNIDRLQLARYPLILDYFTTLLPRTVCSLLCICVNAMRGSSSTWGEGGMR